MIAYAPSGASEWFAERFPGVGRIPQHGANLGDRLAAVFAEAWKLRYQPCVVIGSDMPHISPAFLQQAFEALKPGPFAADVVLGPASDGGYYLIGMNWPQAAMFQEIAWSTDQTLRQTLERALQLNLRVRLLPIAFDVDEPADLDRLSAALPALDKTSCKATRGIIAFWRETRQWPLSN